MGYDQDYLTLPITFERGLLESVEDSMLPPGSCAKCQNWEADPSGNLRVRTPWQKASTTSAPGTRKGWGIGHFSNQRRPVLVQRATNSGNATEPVTMTCNWTAATLAGSTLIAKVWYYASTYTPDAFTRPSGYTNLGGIGALSHFPRTIVYINEDAASESTFSCTLGTTNPVIIYWVVELLEYANVEVGTVKNLIDGTIGSFEDPWIPSTVTPLNSTAAATESYYSTSERPCATAACWARFATSGSGVSMGFTTPTGTSGMAVTTGTEYTASVYMKKYGGTDRTCKVDILWYNSGGTYLSTSSDTGDSVSSSAWVRLSNTATAPANAAFAALQVYAASSTADTYYFGGPQFEAGSSATTYHPGSVSDSVIGISYNGANSAAFSATTISAPSVPVYVPVLQGILSDNYTSSAESSDYTEYIDATMNSARALSWRLDDEYRTTAQSETFSSTLSGASQWACALFLLTGDSYLTTDGYFAVANNETTQFGIYALDKSNLSAGTWESLETIAATPTSLPVAFTSGNGFLYYTHPAFAAIHTWQGRGTSPSTIANSPAGRCIAWHKSRLFVAGTNGLPWYLYYSEVGDATTWSGGTAGYIEVGKGDGEAIEDITPVEDGLLIGKQTSLWYLVGAGPDSFRLIRLPANTGVAPGRTITPTPYGALLAGPHGLQVYSSGSVSSVSKAIRESYEMTGDWMSGAVVEDQYYVLDQGSGTIWGVDLTEGSWHTEAVSSPTTEGPAVLYNHDRTLLFAPQNATAGSLLSYRYHPGTTLGKDFDTLSEEFEAWTPEIWPLGPEQRLTPRYLFLKVRQRGSGYEQAGLTITPVYDGREQNPVTVEPFDSAGVYWVRKSIGSERGVSSFQLKFTQTATNGTSVVWDVEECTLGFNSEKVR